MIENEEENEKRLTESEILVKVDDMNELCLE